MDKLESKIETVKDITTWLASYKDMYYRLIYIDNKITNLKSISYDDEKGGTVIATPKSTVSLIMEKDYLQKDMHKIEHVIKSIDDNKQRYTLDYKFLQFYSINEIADIMHYSPSQINRYYYAGISAALGKYRKITNTIE